MEEVSQNLPQYIRYKDIVAERASTNSTIIIIKKKEESIREIDMLT